MEEKERNIVVAFPVLGWQPFCWIEKVTEKSVEVWEKETDDDG
jgi:hypothetical protein